MPDGGRGFAPSRVLPYGRQTIEADDFVAIAEALHADLLTTGPMVERFERALAETVGAQHAVACINGTAALHMAVKALGLGPGDTAIVPAVTFLATANACAYEGAEVVFADVDPATGLMTPEALAHALHRSKDRKVRAILPVHLCGAACDGPGIAVLAESAGAQVIEDACHALGTTTPWGPVGSCSDSAMTCFSFHPVKTVTTGEGGAVTTNDPNLAERLRMARNHGVTRNPDGFQVTDEAFDDGAQNPWWYEQVELGWNYRLPDINCALGLTQLAKLPRFAERRRALAARYRQLLAPLAPLVRPVEIPPGTDPVLHLMVVRIDFAAIGKSRRQVMEALKAKGVGTQVHYIPVPMQPYWAARVGPLDLPGTNAWYRSVLSLPLFPGMEDDDPERVVDALAKVLGA